jgi:hypothetical protein
VLQHIPPGNFEIIFYHSFLFNPRKKEPRTKKQEPNKLKTSKLKPLEPLEPIEPIEPIEPLEPFKPTPSSTTSPG